MTLPDPDFDKDSFVAHTREKKPEESQIDGFRLIFSTTIPSVFQEWPQYAPVRLGVLETKLALMMDVLDKTITLTKKDEDVISDELMRLMEANEDGDMEAVAQTVESIIRVYERRN